MYPLNQSQDVLCYDLIVNYDSCRVYYCVKAERGSGFTYDLCVLHAICSETDSDIGGCVKKKKDEKSSTLHAIDDKGSDVFVCVKKKKDGKSSIMQGKYVKVYYGVMLEKVNKSFDCQKNIGCTRFNLGMSNEIKLKNRFSILAENSIQPCDISKCEGNNISDLRSKQNRVVGGKIKEFWSYEKYSISAEKYDQERKLDEYFRNVMKPIICEEMKLSILERGSSELNSTADLVKPNNSSPGGYTVQSHKVKMIQSSSSTDGSMSTVCKSNYVKNKNLIHNDTGQKKRSEKSNLKVGFCNSRSANNKTETITDYVTDLDLDLYYITESWSDENSKKTAVLKPPGYKLHDEPRLGRAGGGISCLYKAELDVKKIKPPKINGHDNTGPQNISTMEILETLLTVNNKKVRIVCIYRPDSSKANKYKMSKFYEEINELMVHYNMCSEEVIMIGDYNFHMNKPERSDVKKFTQILDICNLIQHVTEPTHELGNTLDLLITRKDTCVIEHSVDFQLSDHKNVLFSMNIKKPPCPVKEITYRKLRNINNNKFDLATKIKEGNDILKGSDIERILELYNSSLRSTLDMHAPEIKKHVMIRKPTPWSTEMIKPEKQKRRRLEKIANRTKNEIDKQLFKEQKNKVNHLLETYKKDYYSKLIHDNKDDPKNLFKYLNEALHRKDETIFPPSSSDVELSEQFSAFFNGKIDKIRDKLDRDIPLSHHSEEQVKYNVPMSEFKSLSEDEVRDLIKKTSNKHCLLDPAPTYIVKDNLEEILPLITKIINLSLQLGDMPQSMKHAIIKPLLKKSGLELVHNNYRPVSNLSYLSKLIERAVASQLISHLKINGLMDVYQSAYKMYNSTETALLKVRNDILMEMDKNNTAMLILLDLSAAFDTIDHNILIRRLEKRCGLKGTVLSWFISYLRERTQSVMINGQQSKPVKIKYGVPQGSVLGPILFTIYTSPLSEIFCEYDMDYHCYADDTQIYMGFNAKNEEDQKIAVDKMEKCIRAVKNFMNKNKLKLNDDKTEFVLIGTKYWVNKLKFNDIMVGETKISATEKARNLGVVFDKEMGMKSHISNMCKTGFHNLRNLSAIRCIINKQTAKTAAHAFVTSGLDYCNSLLYGLPESQLRRLQLVHNAAARVVVKKKKFDHISEDLKDLHWLPIKSRIKFKLLLLTWKALNGQAPLYLKELLKYKVKTHDGRVKNTLFVPKTKLVTCGDRAFSSVAPMLWNSLPNNLRNIDKVSTFKNKLKTFLFKEAYD